MNVILTLSDMLQNNTASPYALAIL